MSFIFLVIPSVSLYYNSLRPMTHSRWWGSDRRASQRSEALWESEEGGTWCPDLEGWSPELWQEIHQWPGWPTAAALGSALQACPEQRSGKYWRGGKKHGRYSVDLRVIVLLKHDLSFVWSLTRPPLQCLKRSGIWWTASCCCRWLCLLQLLPRWWRSCRQPGSSQTPTWPLLCRCP